MRVGIIGGGVAGLVTAWLLDPVCKVTLFEKEPVLGGHAHTVYVPIENTLIPVETGFEFFSDAMFPFFKKLLSVLKVPVRSYPLTYVFFEPRTGNSFVLPPFGRHVVEWHTLISAHLMDLFQFKHFVTRAESIVDTKSINVTIEEFVEGLLLTTSFKNTFLYPFLAACWGAPLDDFKSFSAYDVLMWYVKNQPTGLQPLVWNEIEGGTRVYIDALQNTLYSTDVRLSVPSIRIERMHNGYKVIQKDGLSFEFDELVIATNATQAASLLAPLSGTEHLRAVLEKITYFPTKIAVHGDPRLMPRNKNHWSIVNVRSEESFSALTIHKPWLTSQLVLRSWVTYDTPLDLHPLYSICHYDHLRVTPDYFYAQKALEFMQGKEHIWLSGMYTYGIDSHESAICSAFRVAQALAPASARLKEVALFSI